MEPLEMRIVNQLDEVGGKVAAPTTKERGEGIEILDNVILALGQKALKDLKDVSEDQINTIQEKLNHLHYIIQINQTLPSEQVGSKTPYQLLMTSQENLDIKTLKEKVENCTLLLKAMIDLKARPNYNSSFLKDLQDTAGYQGVAIRKGFQNLIDKLQSPRIAFAKKPTFQEFVRDWVGDQLRIETPGAYMIRESATIKNPKDFYIFAVSYKNDSDEVMHSLIAKDLTTDLWYHPHLDGTILRQDQSFRDITTAAEKVVREFCLNAEPHPVNVDSELAEITRRGYLPIE